MALCHVLGMTLLDYLQKHGLSQQALGDRLGLTQSTISRYVSGERMPKREHLRRIMEETGGLVTPTDFLIGNTNMACAVAVINMKKLTPKRRPR